MAVRMSLDEKIEKAEAVVAAAKKKYDDALDELEKLVAKRKELDDKKVLEAIQQLNRRWGVEEPTIVGEM